MYLATQTKIYRSKDGKDVKLIPSLQGRYEIHDKEHNFIIKETDVDDDGIYTCSTGSASADIEVIGELNEKKPTKNNNTKIEYIDK